MVKKALGRYLFANKGGAEILVREWPRVKRESHIL